MNIESFKSGSAKVNITPPLGTIINGDFVSHYARYVHDPLFAKALVMQSGKTIIAIIVVDICIMDVDFIKAVKAAITGEACITDSNILISSTHTHAAGSVTDLLLGTTDLAYRQKLPSLIVEAVLRSKQNCRPAQIAFGSVDAQEHVVCRRYFMKDGFVSLNPVTQVAERIKTNPVGAEDKIERRVAAPDTQLSFLGVRGIDGRWISLVGNYSLHYVGDWEQGTISADYFGVFSNSLQKKLEADDSFVAMMSNGTSGDVNIWDFCDIDRYPTKLFEKCEFIGCDLAEKVFLALKNVTWDSNPSLLVKYIELPVAIRKPSSDEIELSIRLMEETDFENIVIDQDGLQRLYAREQLLLNEYPETVHVPIQVFGVGYGTIGALSGEFFSETGLWLKEKSSSSHYFTISMANGYHGYVPPAHEIELGGYETWPCRSSYLERNAENKIRNKLLALMKSINNTR